MLEIIEIENVKGIGLRRFNLNILPNKPSLLVAPNGFGKSSIAAAFKSLNNRRIDLKDDDFHQENSQLNPRIFIQYRKPNNSVVQLSANKTSNSISDEFSYFVINNQVKPKGIGSQFGRASASLEIEDVVLENRIPPNVSFDYQYREIKLQFGNNSKVLPNARIALDNLKLMDLISSKYQSLQRANGQRIQVNIQAVIDDINQQEGTSDNLLQWVSMHKIDELKNIDYLNDIGEIVNGFDLGLNLNP